MLYHGLHKIVIDKNIVLFTRQVCQTDVVFIKKGFDQFLGPFYRLKISWKKWAKLGGGGRS